MMISHEWLRFKPKVRLYVPLRLSAASNPPYPRNRIHFQS